mmetsp:Transcript_103191/g.300948  ORF Transcript_103191/g.300948 Transcript_103191/m.300948 type:complete len:413 (-) Transcript_103191:114-1352(-)
MQAQREALANLMNQVPSAESSHGRGRHRHSGTQEAWQGYEDRTACEWFLVGDFCIFDLFKSTKESIGCCTRKHFEAVKESYLRARKRRRETDLRLDKYESGCLRRMQAMLQERDAYIEVKRAQAEDAAEENQRAAAAEGETLSAEVGESASRMVLLSQEAQSKTQEAEELGSKGHVREAEAALAEASRMKAERDVLMMLQAKAAAIRGNQRHQRALSGLRRPCEVCGAMLPLDVDSDITKGHNLGRIHQAWVKLRDEYARLLRRAQEAEAAGFSPPRGVLSAAALRTQVPSRRLHSAKVEIQLASTQGATRRMTAALAWRALQEEDRAGGTDSRALLRDAQRSPRGDRRAERRCQGRSRSRSKNSGDRRRRRGGSREDAKRSRKAKTQSPILTHQKRGVLEEGEHDLEEGEL